MSDGESLELLERIVTLLGEIDDKLERIASNTYDTSANTGYIDNSAMEKTLKEIAATLKRR
jgi:hypothetical protein